MVFENNVTSWERLSALRQSIARKGFVRIMEAHSGLSGIVAENARVEVEGEVLEYDGLWESSLTDSATKGMPDASIVGYDSRTHTIDEILNVTTKPIIVDGDTGGEPVQFEYLVRHLERLGVSAVIEVPAVVVPVSELVLAADDSLEVDAEDRRLLGGGKANRLERDLDLR